MANEPNAQPIGWYLEGTLNDDRTWVVPITVFPFRVGRHKDCDLPLMPKNISRYHAEIVPLESDLIIRDLESSNGTYVNHKRIRREMALKSGDTVHFGTLEFQILKKDVIDAALGESTILYKNVDEIPKGYDAYMPTFEEMLRKKAVVPYYQPIIKMSSKSIIGYEVLGRSFYKDLPSSPVELFNIASCIGLEADLSQVFRDEGVRVAKSKQGSPNLFVNTHPVEMYRMTLLESLKDIRKLAPALPITLEVNEKSVYDLSLMKQLRLALNDLNIGLAYDDFGAGQARFKELIEVPPDYLKFDPGLIRNIHKATKKFQHLVKSLVKMAQDLDIDTVAEGIEGVEEYEICLEMGFNYAQGFYFGRPAPADEVLA